MKKVLQLLFLLFFAVNLPAQHALKGANGKWGVKDFDGEIILPFDYDEINISDYSKLSTVKKDGFYGLFNKNGKELLQIQYNYIQVLSTTLMKSELIRVNKSGKQGLFDSNGKILLPVKFDDTSILTNFLIGRMAKDTLLWIHDLKGRLLFKIHGYSVEDSPPYEALIKVPHYAPFSSTRYEYYNTKGKRITEISKFPHKGYTIDFIDKRNTGGGLKYGIKDPERKWLIPPEYTQIIWSGNNQFMIVKEDSLSGVFDIDNRIVVPMAKHQIVRFYDGPSYIVTEPDTYRSGKALFISIYNLEGQLVFGPVFYKTRELIYMPRLTMNENYHPNNYLEVYDPQTQQCGLLGLVVGRLIVPVEFTKVIYSSDDLPIICIKISGSVQLSTAYSTKGQKLLSKEYIHLSPTRDANLLIGANYYGKYGLIKISDDGASAVFEYDKIKVGETGHLFVWKDRRCQILRPNGKKFTKNFYHYLKDPDSHEKKHFSRMPGFKGELVAIAQKTEKKDSIVIGINDRGKEYYLNVEAAKAALQERIHGKVPIKKVEPTPDISHREVGIRSHIDDRETSDNVSEIDTTKVYDIFDSITLPSFPGGEDSLSNFLVRHLKYPAIAREKGVEGVVSLGILVERDGVISNISVMKGIGSGCNEEAIRLVKMMPLWIPGKLSGTSVRTHYTVRVRFKL